MDIEEWLRGLGLQQYVAIFRDNAIDAEVLPELTEADLEKVGILLGHRKRLLRAIAGVAAAETGVGVAAVDSASSHGDRAERRQLTVMFADLVDSTALSSRLDPEEMGTLLRAYQNAVAGEVVRFDGHIAKFMGDGVLAYFGWPKAHEDDAERAVRTGLAVVAAAPHLRGPTEQPLAVRVGIGTGLVVVGELIGDYEARERAVVGETPNLATTANAGRAEQRGDQPKYTPPRRWSVRACRPRLT
jgi:class 3 adenylate cyclase